MAFMTESSSSSYPSEPISVTVAGVTATAVEDTWLGGDGGGVNERSTWSNRLTRFGLRGLTSGCCAGCFFDAGRVFAGFVDST